MFDGDQPMWRLSIECGPSTASVFGTFDKLKAYLDDYHDGTLSGLSGNLLVEGHCDTADRAPVIHTFVREAISSMQLVQY